jgi:hypothetical protein
MIDKNKTEPRTLIVKKVKLITIQRGKKYKILA